LAYNYLFLLSKLLLLYYILVWLDSSYWIWEFKRVILFYDVWRLCWIFL